MYTGVPGTMTMGGGALKWRLTVRPTCSRAHVGVAARQRLTPSRTMTRDVIRGMDHPPVWSAASCLSGCSWQLQRPPGRLIELTGDRQAVLRLKRAERLRGLRMPDPIDRAGIVVERVQALLDDEDVPRREEFTLNGGW